MATSWVLAEHIGPAGLASIEADWRRLYAEMPNPAMWHSFEANRVYLGSLCPAPERMRYFTLSDGEQVRSILPIEERLELSLMRPFPVWGMPWEDGWVMADAVGIDDEARAALPPMIIDHLRSQPGRPPLLVLGRTSKASAFWRDVADAVRPADLFVFEDGAAYIVPTNISAEQFLGSLSGKSRRTLSRADGRFSALPGARYVRAVAPDELEAELECFLDVEASGWKGRAGSAIRAHPTWVAYYRGLAKGMVRDGHCEVHALHVDDRCVAAAFNVYTGRQVAGVKSGYDEEFSALGPGRLVVHKTLEWSCEDVGIDYVNEISDAEWLRMWHPESDDMLKAYVVMRAPLGRLLLVALRFRFGLARTWMRAYRAWAAQRAAKRTAARAK